MTIYSSENRDWSFTQFSRALAKTALWQPGGRIDRARLPGMNYCLVVCCLWQLLKISKMSQGWHRAGRFLCRQYYLADVCYASGFNSPEHFAAAFQQKNHCSPTQYR